MLTVTSEYALRAMICIARRAAGRSISGREIAEETRVPAKYLSKVLGDLVRGGLLVSSPGKNGGFRLRRPTRSLALIEVLKPFERFEERRCPFCQGLGDDSRVCLAHDRWKEVLEAQLRFLQETTLHEIAIGDDEP